VAAVALIAALVGCAAGAGAVLLLVERGPAGVPGPQGLSGPRGARGPAGASESRLRRLAARLTRVEGKLQRFDDAFGSVSHLEGVLTDQDQRQRRLERAVDRLER
jgi:hypothetical protein